VLLLKQKKLNIKVNTISIENETDQLVYQLYGLTEEEIQIIENGIK
jgi:hypothetical protein